MFYKNFFKRLVFLLAFTLTLPAFANDWLYTVRPNELSTHIGNKYLTNPYRIDEVLKYNEIDNPSDLLPGTVLKIPLNMLKFGPARVQVIALQGSVELQRAEITEDLSTVHSIQYGDKIITGDNSSVMFKFADQSELLLGSGSELIFDVLTQWGRTGMVDSRMRLLKGSIEGRVETLEGPGAHFEVHTPSAVATVRGTEFRVRVGKDNTEVTYNEVNEGKVQVENNVKPLLVPEGFGIVSEQGKAADKPIELLKAPMMTKADEQYPAHPVTLAWQTNPEATGYRVELFKDKEFKQRTQSVLVQQNSISLNDIDAGHYAVRVRAVDNNGLEGMDAKHFFELKAAPKAPTGISVKPVSIAGEQLSFNWHAPATATNYQLQLAQDTAFEQLVAEETLNEAEFTTTDPMKDGNYYWRVAATNEHGTGYYSETGQFKIELPEVPSIEKLSDIEVGDSVVAQWSKVSHATTYQWQLALDSEFTDLVASGEINSEEITLKDIAEGDYFFRVAAVGPHNEKRFSQEKSVQVYETGNGKNPFMLSSLLLLLLIL